MKRSKRRSVKLRIWEYFCLYTVGLLVLIWAMQILSLQYFYIGSMARETLDNARKIVSQYEAGTLNEGTVRRLAFDSNLSVMITDADGTIISANDAVGDIGEQRVLRFSHYAEKIGDLPQKLQNDPRHEVYYRFTTEDNKNQTLFFVSFTEKGPEKGGAYIYVISQLEPITSVISVLQRQFIGVTLIAVAVSLVCAYVMAQRFSKPIEKLTRSAKELALGNTTVVFESDEFTGEIRDLAQTLDYAASEITRSAELRRELMANVSHDLRTPLTMIKMYAEMVRDLSGDNKEKREKHLQIIIDETDRLTTLVQDILDLSRIENAHVEMNVKAFDLSKMITDILERFSVMVEQGYRFELEAPSSVYALGDPTRIQQVIYNLLSNAINYTGEDKKVRIRVTRGFETVKVEVIDTGEGIPQEEIGNIWDRYYRAKEHIRSKVGTGLGLSIVKSILIAHKAEFGIQSQQGVGSDFWFELQLPESQVNKTLRLPDNHEVPPVGNEE